MDDRLLQRITVPNPPPFALLHRPESAAGQLDVLFGAVSIVDKIADIPLRTGMAAGTQDVLALLPYRQVVERGFDCLDDGTPLVVLTVDEQESVPVEQLTRMVPDLPIQVRDERFDLDDADYADLVRRVLADEIGRGEGANFVLKRSFLATIVDYSPAVALTAFCRLLREESGAYWTYLVHTGSRTLIGASPERHLTVSDGVATMNPISGTYRYPRSGASVVDALSFLSDRKESDELYMVLDEELKVMGRICSSGGHVIGPRLKPMARLAHTEYLIEGHTDLDVRQVLRESVFAPTVTGGPLQNACRVIARHERTGRGYYAGALALIGADSGGRTTLDSAIAIRTADVDPAGRLRIDVGATLVRGSDPDAEVRETWAKAATVRAAFGPGGGRVSGADTRPSDGWARHPAVLAALRARNDRLAPFWLTSRPGREPESGPRVLVVDCEDAFTSMLTHQLVSLGLRVVVEPIGARSVPSDHDLVVLGPGPGDPRDLAEPKIAAMHALVRRLLGDRILLLAICLGHQVLSSVLGLELVRRAIPNQGTQLPVDLFGRRMECGFYNTFAARADNDLITSPLTGGLVELSRDGTTGEVNAMRGRGFCSVQFHPESVLTKYGVNILSERVTDLIRMTAHGEDPGLLDQVVGGMGITR
ncbi:anthranilate synthase family protein [Actinophytocola sp.]|uniref:anthranilate synthase family protein n=1 Tax=Actinophytocola sp. TaxID=1872138 RepID=UPI002ED59BB2